MRFTTPDALMELHYDVSPYAYCLNNPIMYIDPLGLDTCTYNPADDTFSSIENPSLPDVEVVAKKKNSSNGGSVVGTVMVFVDLGNQVGTTYSKSIYQETNRFYSGYYTNSKGQQIPLTVLERRPDGKFQIGVEGHRNGLNNAMAKVSLLNRTLTVTGYVSTAYNIWNFRKNPSIENAAVLVIDGVSYAAWQVGVVSAGVQGMIWASTAEREQIQTNIKNNGNTLNNVYVPGLGTPYYSPF